MMHFFRGLGNNLTLTHLDLSGIELSARAVYELIKSLQSNHVLQEIKIQIKEVEQGLEKMVNRSSNEKFRLSS